MKKFKYLFGSALFFIMTISVSLGQTVLDSAIIHRNSILKELKLLDDTTIPRTWNKMSEIKLKALEVIEVDNVLINEYLLPQIEINTELQNNIEKLKMEIALVKKETELQAWHLEENKFMFKVFLAVIGGLCVLLIVLLILFVDRQIKYSSIKIELERTWPVREELEKDNSLQQEISRLNKQIGELTIKNSLLSSEANSLKLENVESQNRLEKEILSKKQIEEEIKKLIDQIKVNN